jgi:hypothetical protein
MARYKAMRFICSLTKNGPIESTVIRRYARNNGIANITLRRAAKALRIKAKKDGPIVNGERTWRWHPGPPPLTRSPYAPRTSPSDGKMLICPELRERKGI